MKSNEFEGYREGATALDIIIRAVHVTRSNGTELGKCRKYVRFN